MYYDTLPQEIVDFVRDVFLLYTVGLFRLRSLPRAATRVHITYRADGWIDLRYWTPAQGKVLP